MNKNLKKLLVLLVAGLALVSVFFVVWQPNEEEVAHADDLNFRIASLNIGINPFETQYVVDGGELHLYKSWLGAELSLEQEEEFLNKLETIFGIENTELDQTTPLGLVYRNDIPVVVERDSRGITLNFLDETRRFEFLEGSSLRLLDENGFEYNLYD